MSERSILRSIERVYSVILIILTVAMFITVAYNVFMRFVVNRSVGWADELSRFIFIWVSFLGAVLAFKDDEHVGLSFVVDRFRSEAVRRAFAIVQRILVLTVLGFMTWFGYLASTTVMNVSPALSIPMAQIYLIVPFCGLLMWVIGVVKLVLLVGGKIAPTSIHTSVE